MHGDRELISTRDPGTTRSGLLLILQDLDERLSVIEGIVAETESPAVLGGVALYVKDLEQLDLNAINLN